MEKTILLTTLNAKYVHTSLALRSLKANMAHLTPYVTLCEFTINDDLLYVVSRILEYKPQVVGFSLSIWNIKESTFVIDLLRKLSPSLFIVVGGPEARFESEQKAFYKDVDYVIEGEGEKAFAELVDRFYSDREKLPSTKRIKVAPLDLTSLSLPYDEYSEDDLAHRLIYVEASRGCPYECQFCLSSRDESVRLFDQTLFLQSLAKLWEKGARKFKFIDRTFNLSLSVMTPILDFFLSQKEDYFIHFEMVPERFPPLLKEKLKLFKEGALQLEIGFQTFNPYVASLIKRPFSFEKIEENIKFLLEETKVHLHTDLIAGLPGESFESFAQGFDKTYQMGVQEIQVGLLKRLSGAPITKLTDTFELLFNREPPFTILQTSTMSYEELLKIRLFAYYWEMYGNVTPFRLRLSELISLKRDISPFKNFLHFFEDCHKKTKSLWGLSLKRKEDLLEDYLKRLSLS